MIGPASVNQPAAGRWRDLLARVGVFMTGNASAQFISALAGLLLTRWMSTPEYAVYTVFTFLMGALAVLSKGGVHFGFTTLLGQYWPDPLRTSSLIQSLISVRRLIALVVGPPIMILAGLLLLRNGAGMVQTAALLVLLILFWIADLRTRIIDQILFFAHQAGRTQLLDAALNLARIVTIVGLFMVQALNAMTAALLVVLAAVLRIPPIDLWLRRVLEGRKMPAAAGDVAELKAVTWRQMPVEIYYVAQAPLILACLSLFGDVQAVAGFGALTRLAMLLVPAQAFSLAFCTPILARARHRLLRTYLALVALCAIPSIVLLVAAWAVPQALLWIVGPHYADQIDAVRVCAATSAFTSVAGLAWGLAAHRGWNHWTRLQIPVGILWCIVGTQLLDVGTVSGALWLSGGFSIGLVAATVADLVRAARKGELS